MKSRIQTFRERTTKYCAPGITAGLVAICALLAITPAGQATSWKSKDWTQWTIQDCNEIATDSPWADTNRQHKIYYSNHTDLFSPATAVISSSLIIRQAFVRQQQLMLGQAAVMTSEMRKQADEILQRRSDACLTQDFGDRIVVTISGVVQDEFETPPNLEVSGRKYSPVEVSQEDPIGKACSSHMLLGGRPALVYVYPRVLNGQPVIGPNDKKIVVTTPPSWARDFTFNRRKMVYNGKSDF